MEKQKIYDFLRDLSANNSKEWMDAHRKRYTEAREIWLDEIDRILHRLSRHNPNMSKIRAKDTVTRINNNRRFHPDKPIYKDNFAFSPSGVNEPSFYIHISPAGSFIGGGLYHPDGEQLNKIRAAIDYNGEELKCIASTDEFLSFYGGIDDDNERLKTSPRGYTTDHPHIDLLQRKNFTAIRILSENEVISDGFIDLVEKAYLIVTPFNNYLQQAISFEA